MEASADSGSTPLDDASDQDAGRPSPKRRVWHLLFPRWDRVRKRHKPVTGSVFYWTYWTSAMGWVLSAGWVISVWGEEPPMASLLVVAAVSVAAAVAGGWIGLKWARSRKRPLGAVSSRLRLVLVVIGGWLAGGLTLVFIAGNGGFQ